MYEVHEDDFDDWAQEHDLRIIWKCPTLGCGYEYEERFGYNEALNCPDCGAQTRKAGESYC
ncbi:MAG: hypothetical protein WC554_16605 [Clostridia bacterium]|jgi:rRNA maturation endonuclease Nob1